MNRIKTKLSIFMILCIVLSSLITLNANAITQNTLLGMDAYLNYLTKKSVAEEVVVAVLDSGVANIDILAEDLISGYDFVDDDFDATDKISDDHGTMISSIISVATGDLPIKIMPLKILQNKYVQIENLVNGIRYAVDNGADIINLSVGGTVSDCSQIDEAVKYANDNDVIVVVAAGNAGEEIENYCPAHNSSAITVSSVSSNMDFSEKFSNYGKYIDFCAPGENIVTYDADGMEKTVSGTSFATAFITSGIAMILSEHPEFSVDELTDTMKSVCLDLGEKGFDNYYGYGLPQFNKLIPTSIEIFDFSEDGIVDYKTTITFYATITGSESNMNVEWYVNGKHVFTGNVYTISRVKDDFNIQAKLVQQDTVLDESEVENITVKNGLFDKIVAFFREIFGTLPVI